jgi:lipoprotein-anchoring transpeptidase ErfK/SrfK
VIPVRVLVRLLAVTALAVIGVVAMGLSTAGSGSHTAPAVAGTVQAHPAAPAKPVAWSLPPHMPAGAALIGRVTVPIRTGAGWVRPVTPLGSDTWLLILHHHGRHGVALIPTSGTPKTARIDLAELDLRWTRVRVVVNLSRLRLSVLRGRRLLGSFPVAAGMASTPTPTGRFSVTDRVTFPPGSTYGSFALGLSVHQSQLLRGWRGGSQIAIHGTSQPSSIGRYASLGCIRVPRPALRLLERIVPLGGPVTIHA